MKKGDNKRGPAHLPTRNDEAAGGAVLSADGGVLSIVLIATDRHGHKRWSLPKGHFKGEENREQCAVREVREETGLDVEVLGELGTVDYWFTEGKYRYHKYVHYFFMRATGGRFEDHDDEVVEVRRFAWDDALKHMAYPSERKLVASLEARARELAGLPGGR